MEAFHPLVTSLLLIIFGIFATWNGLKGKVYCRYWLTCAALIWVGLLSFLTFHIIGSTVDQEGVLHETFGFLAISALLSFLGINGVIILSLLRVIKNLKKLLQHR